QLYVLVAQTDLSGIWLVPKRRRYLAFMVGSLVDLVSYSILAMVVYTGRHGWYHLPRNADLLISAVMLTYGTRVAWQWCFFLRVGIPVLWGYCYQVLLLVTGGHIRFTSIDFATIAVLGLMLDGGGLYLWLRSMYRRGRQRYAARQAARLTSDERLETVAGAREPGMA